MLDQTLLVKQGYGAPELHIRQQQQTVINFLGMPDRKRRGRHNRDFWIYDDLGMDVSISTKSGRVLSLFFYRDGADGHRQAEVKTDRGISLAETKRKVLAAYGQPNNYGAPFILSTGDRVREWFSYRSGIGFHFGPDERVDILTIFSSPRSGIGKEQKANEGKARRS